MAAASRAPVGANGLRHCCQWRMPRGARPEQSLSSCRLAGVWPASAVNPLASCGIFWNAGESGRNFCGPQAISPADHHLGLAKGVSRNLALCGVPGRLFPMAYRFAVPPAWPHAGLNGAAIENWRQKCAASCAAACAAFYALGARARGAATSTGLPDWLGLAPPKVEFRSAPLVPQRRRKRACASLNCGRCA